jgi:hypothetical protein
MKREKASGAGDGRSFGKLKRSFGRTRFRHEDNVETDLKHNVRVLAGFVGGLP